MHKDDVKTYNFFIKVSSISAWTYFTGLLVAYLLATIILGRVPHYDFPDPKHFSFYEPLELLLNIAGNVWIVSILLWLTFTALRIKDNLNYIKSKSFLLGLLGHLLAIGIFLSDIAEWWAD